MKASALYRSELWRVGLAAARILPVPVLEGIASSLALGYYSVSVKRRRVVVNNLLPVVGFDARAAHSQCRALFRQFGLKLADLWRYEAGCNINDATVDPGNWERFEATRAQGRGVLIVTPHIGNWEFGAPILRRRGVSLQVITQPEPQQSLTRIRENSRARLGIETIVIGENPFAFVEVIRRLDQGATVALLVDRPPPATATTVKLFGHKFEASIAAAELARASGCALLPVCLPRIGNKYAVELLPEIGYDRASLGTREARANLTQQIMTQFEPVIRRYINQWFHFVPLWQNDREVRSQGS